MERSELKTQLHALLPSPAPGGRRRDGGRPEAAVDELCPDVRTENVWVLETSPRVSNSRVISKMTLFRQFQKISIQFLCLLWSFMQFRAMFIEIEEK